MVQTNCLSHFSNKVNVKLSWLDSFDKREAHYFAKHIPKCFTIDSPFDKIGFFHGNLDNGI